MGDPLMHTTSMRALACLAAACLALAVASSDSMVEEFAQKENSSTLLDTQDQVVAWKKVSKKIIKACRKKYKDFVGDPAFKYSKEQLPDPAGPDWAHLCKHPKEAPKGLCDGHTPVAKIIAKDKECRGIKFFHDAMAQSVAYYMQAQEAHVTELYEQETSLFQDLLEEEIN